MGRGAWARAYADLVDLLVGSLGEGGTVPWTDAVGLVATVTRSDTAAWHEVAWRRREVNVHAWPDPALDDRLRALTLAHAVEHPLLRHYIVSGDRSVLDPTDVCASWRRHPMFELAREATGVTEMLGLPVAHHDGTFSSFALGRTSRAYRDGERRDVERLARLLQTADRAGRAPTAGTGGTASDVAWAVHNRLLSCREGEVLAALADGSTRAAAARRLGMSVRTLDKHLEHVYARLGVTSLVGAMSVLPQHRSGPVERHTSPHR